VAVKIKLKRMGKIRAPYYRIIVADARTKRDGRPIEEIGKYHPKLDPSLIEVDSGRAQYWLSVGAQPTGPVRRLLEITGDWQRFKGLPGAEGSLKEPAAHADKKDVFAAAVAETLAGAGKGKADAAKADAAKAGDGKGRARETGGGKAKTDAAKGGEAKAGQAKGRAREAGAGKGEAGAATADAAKAGDGKGRAREAGAGKGEAGAAKAGDGKGRAREAGAGKGEAGAAKADTRKGTADAAGAGDTARRARASSRDKPAGKEAEDPQAEPAGAGSTSEA
jgi:small subunit ribosomal protein S16